MAYTSWSVVFGEQPSAAKWNILGTNDASFNDGSGLNAIANPITAASGSHLQLVAGTNKLVKTAVLRQDDTTNTYQNGNTVILTGWGVITATATFSFNESVSFGVTFSQAPIVMAIYGGDHASSSTYGSGAATLKIALAQAGAISTTGFTVTITSRDGSNWSAGNKLFYQWLAIGELA